MLLFLSEQQSDTQLGGKHLRSEINKENKRHGSVLSDSSEYKLDLQPSLNHVTTGPAAKDTED